MNNYTSATPDDEIEMIQGSHWLFMQSFYRSLAGCLYLLLTLWLCMILFVAALIIAVGK